MIHWVPEYRPTAVRGFKCDTQEEAERLCAAQESYDITMTITVIRSGVITVTQAKAGCGVHMAGSDLIRLAFTLHRSGITDAYFERQFGRQSGFGSKATLVESGPLAGMFHVDIAAVVAGSDGDY